ncbi:uncharacterized protein N7511_004204 [Penicillium nucicola]|uniref:uncharacterized protein n=1 Tax=Penicillium nucicola TaxID=1850975 RepID=UPI0025454848|nr:uncharacterized protein N7511_004204 [Penicillium nucicola]KAJ5766588.1 hypothetical protein N7511_004204 [Penicillium nucicola]
MASKTSISKCNHSSLCFSSSPNATVAGFRRPTQKQRVAAAKPKNDASENTNNLNVNFLNEDDRAFPAPLVLPGDDLSEDPEYPAQSFQEWLDDEDRNPVKPKQKKLFVCSVPEVFDGVEFLKDWKPEINLMATKEQCQPPNALLIQDYLKAFYHGLPIGMTPTYNMRYTTWTKTKKTSGKQKIPKYVGLDIGGGEVVRIRIRERPGGDYPGQLNLNDLLDAAIAILPKSAYALLLLVHFDLYEDDEDSFVCGRAYGGSRVAVVSTARYNPLLDDSYDHQVERVHPWPASHCEEYVNTYTKEELEEQPPSKRPRTIGKGSRMSAVAQNGPLREAVSAYGALRPMKPGKELSAERVNDLWLDRVCRTASHELGHCFGIDHCVYYACMMQGTASLAEDVRQPPYLCPVDLAKVLHATGASAAGRYKALLKYCDLPQNQKSYLFQPFAAWIKSRVAEVEEVSGPECSTAEN